MSEMSEGKQVETGPASPEYCRREHGRGCHRGSGWKRVLVAFLLIGVGVLIGRAAGWHHAHYGPWTYAPWGGPVVTTGQSVPMGKLLDDIGATPEQREKAGASLAGK